MKDIKSFKFTGKKDGVYEGQLLIATPSLTDSCFSRAVVYMCQHDKDGAMGLIINQKVDVADAEKILSQFDISMPEEDFPVYFGGPVDMVRGFILHSRDYENHDTYHINDDLALTSNVEILKDIVAGKGPKQKILALGYSAWDEGQVEEEVQQNSWFSVPASLDIIFHEDDEKKWMLAAESGGVDLLKFSADAGHA